MSEKVRKINFEIPSKEIGKVYDITAKYFETSLTDYVVKEHTKPTRLLYHRKVGAAVVIGKKLLRYHVNLRETSENTVEIDIKWEAYIDVFWPADEDKFNKFVEGLTSYINANLKSEKDRAILSKKLTTSFPNESKDDFFKQLVKYMENKGYSTEESTPPLNATFKKGRGTWNASVFQFRLSDGEDSLILITEWRFPGVTLTEDVEKEFKKEIDDVVQSISHLMKGQKEKKATSTTGLATGSCSKCGKAVSGDFAICPFCGQSLKSVCPKCGKQVSLEFAICPFCGQQLKTSNTCKKCNKELNPEFAMCPFCGEKR